jgi:hypothetical protein
MSEHQVDPGTNGAGHETKDADLKEVVLTGIGMAAGTLIVALVMWGLFNALKVNEQKQGQKLANPMAPAAHFPPEPRLQVNAPEDLKALRKQEDQILDTYGWVDKSGGVVRVPIDRAMDIMLQRGFPARTPAEIAAAEAGHEPAPVAQRKAGPPAPQGQGNAKK